MRTLCSRMSGNRLAEGHYCIPKWFSAAQIDKHIRYRLDAEFIKSRHQDIPNHVRGLGKEASQTDRADWQDQQEPYRILSFLSDKALNIIPLGKKDEAKRYLSSIVQDYPNSSEAKRAKNSLAKLK